MFVAEVNNQVNADIANNFINKSSNFTGDLLRWKQLESAQLEKISPPDSHTPQASPGLRIPKLKRAKLMSVFETFFAFSFVAITAVSLLATALAYQPKFR